MVAAAVVGILVSGGGGKARNGPPPHMPSGTTQDGFGNDNIQPPSVTFVYDAAKHVITFAWKGAAGSPVGLEFVYSINNAPLVGPTKALTVSVPARDPTAECISVGSLGTDGTRHLAGTVCGSA